MKTRSSLINLKSLGYGLLDHILMMPWALAILLGITLLSAFKDIFWALPALISFFFGLELFALLSDATKQKQKARYESQTAKYFDRMENILLSAVFLAVIGNLVALMFVALAVDSRSITWATGMPALWKTTGATFLMTAILRQFVYTIPQTTVLQRFRNLREGVSQKAEASRTTDED